MNGHGEVVPLLLECLQSAVPQYSSVRIVLFSSHAVYNTVHEW